MKGVFLHARCIFSSSEPVAHFLQCIEIQLQTGLISFHGLIGFNPHEDREGQKSLTILVA